MGVSVVVQWSSKGGSVVVWDSSVVVWGSLGDAPEWLGDSPDVA
jgi:hypothetical protein